MDAEFFKVRLSLQQWPSKRPVYFKADGHRFAQASTLKIRANTAYLVEILISPGRTLTAVRIYGQMLFLTEVRADRRSTDKKKYSAIWNTAGYDVNADKTRTSIPVMLEFKGDAALVISLQCKVYMDEDDGNHWQWGQPLHGIEVECTAPEDAVFINVKTERYVSRRLV